MVSFASPLFGSLGSMRLYKAPQYTASFTSHLSPGIFSTHFVELVWSFLGGYESQRGVFLIFSSFCVSVCVFDYPYSSLFLVLFCLTLYLKSDDSACCVKATAAL